MNWDRIAGRWKEVKGTFKAKWGKLTDDDLDVIGGKREQLSGRLQTAYGIAKDEAERQIDEFEKSYREKPSQRTARRGKIGWILLWLLGIPLPILFILFLVRGCT